MEPSLANIYQLLALFRLIWDDIYTDWNKVSYRSKLTVTEEQLLWLIWGLNPINVSDLAHHLLRDKATISKSISSLEQKGLIDRLPGEDRRFWDLVLTEQGQSEMKELALREKRRWAKDGVFGAFTPDEWDELVNGLVKILESFHSEEKKERFLRFTKLFAEREKELIDEPDSP